MDAATKAERSAQVHEGKRKRKKEEGAEVGEEDFVPVVSTYLAPRAAGSLGFQQIFS